MNFWWNVESGTAKIYRVTIMCDRTISGALVTRLYADLAAIQLYPTFVTVTDEVTRGKCAVVTAECECASSNWEAVQQAVQLLTALPHVDSAMWEIAGRST